MPAFDSSARSIFEEMEKLRQDFQTGFDEAGAKPGNQFQTMLESRRILVSILLLSGMGALEAIRLCTILLSTFLVKPNDPLTGTVVAFCRQDFDHEIPGNARKDELGEIVRAIEILRDKSQEARRLQQQTTEDQKQRLEQEKRQRAAEKKSRTRRTASWKNNNCARRKKLKHCPSKAVRMIWPGSPKARTRCSPPCATA